MPSELQYYSALAERTLGSLTAKRGNWTRFLETAARMYKYRFYDQLMIYAQRPDASACAEIELWNEKFDRWARPGSKGVALIDDSGSYPKLKYVFDVSDTEPSRQNARSVRLWEMRQEHETPVLSELAKNYEGIDDGDTLADAFHNIAIQLAREYYEDNRREILFSAENSALEPAISNDFAGTPIEEADDTALRVSFQKALANSVAYTIMARCGLDASEYFDDDDFQAVISFDTPDMANALGVASSTLSEQVLRDIEITIRKYERQHAAERGEHNNERNNERDTDLQQSRGLSPAQPEAERASEGVDGAARQVREDEESVPQRTQADNVQPPAPDGEPLPAPAGDGRSGGGKDGTGDGGADGTGELARQGGRPDGVDGGDERAESAGRGNSPARTDLRIDEAEPQPQTFSQRGKRSIEELLSTSPITMDEVDSILRDGGNLNNYKLNAMPFDSRSSLRIAARFSKGIDDNAAYLRREYLTGLYWRDFLESGKGFDFGSRRVCAWFDKDGITLAIGSTAKNNIHRVTIPWEDAAARIDELMREGRYINREAFDNALDNERRELADKLWFFYRDDVGELPEEWSAEHGGYPDDVALIRSLLDDDDERQSIYDRLEADVNAWSYDTGSRSWHDPPRLLDEMKAAMHPPVIFPNDGFTPIKNFTYMITQDEIDALLIHGGSYTEGKFRFLSFFLGDHDEKEKLEFIKREYGHGGGTWSQTDGWQNAEPGKGLSLYRGDQSKPVAKADLQWNAVIKRTERLIAEGLFMTRAELDRLPNYERLELVRGVDNFYYNLPDEYERPFHSRTWQNYSNTSSEDMEELLDFTYPREAEWQAIRDFLDDTERVDVVLAQMRHIFENTSTEDRYYNSRKAIYEALSAFRDGTYTLFPGLENLPDPDTASRVVALPFRSRREIVEDMREPPTDGFQIGEQRQVEQMSLFDASPLPELRSVDEQRVRIGQKLQKEAEQESREAEATAPAISLPENADTPLLNISENDKARIVERFTADPRSREAVSLVREIYGDSLGMPLPQAMKRIAELVGIGRFSKGLSHEETQTETTAPEIIVPESSEAPELMKPWLENILIDGPKSFTTKEKIYQYFTNGTPDISAAAKFLRDVYGKMYVIGSDLGYLNIVNWESGDNGITANGTLHADWPEVARHVRSLIDAGVYQLSLEEFQEWKSTRARPTKTDTIDPYSLFEKVRNELSERGYAVSDELIEDAINEYPSHGRGNVQDLADFIEDQYLTEEPELEPEREPQAEEIKLNLFQECERIKQENGADIVMWQNRDFFEMYNEDAKTAAEILNFVITKRTGDAPYPYLVSGFPRNSLSSSLRILNEAGYAVAVASEGADDERYITLYDAKPVIENAEQTLADNSHFTEHYAADLDRLSADVLDVLANGVLSPERMAALAAMLDSGAGNSDIEQYLFNTLATESGDYTMETGYDSVWRALTGGLAIVIDSDSEADTSFTVPWNEAAQIYRAFYLNEKNVLVQEEAETAAPEFDFDAMARLVLERVMADADYAEALAGAKSRASLRNPCTWALEQSIRDHQYDEPEVYRRYFSDDDFNDDLFDYVLKQSWANRALPEKENVEPNIQQGEIADAASAIEAEQDETPYKMGDTFYMDGGKPYIVKWIGFHEISYYDPNTPYISKLMEKSDFEALLRDDPLNSHLLPQGDGFTEITDPAIIAEVEEIFGESEPQTTAMSNYAMLGRLKADCEYYLANGNRADKHLWAGNVSDHIKAMRELWNAIPDGEKPEWLTLEQINEYERQMLAGIETAITEDKPQIIADRLYEEPYPSGNNTTAYYLFRCPDGIDAVAELSHETLALIKDRADTYVICADVCYLSESEMADRNIAFRKMPRDWNLLPVVVQEKIRALKPDYERVYVRDLMATHGFDLSGETLNSWVSEYRKFRERREKEKSQDDTGFIESVDPKQNTKQPSFVEQIRAWLSNRGYDANDDTIESGLDKFYALGGRDDVSDAAAFIENEYFYEGFGEEPEWESASIAAPEPPTPNVPRYEVRPLTVVEQISSNPQVVSLLEPGDSGRRYGVYDNIAGNYLHKSDDAYLVFNTEAQARAYIDILIKGVDFRITDDHLGEGGAKTKFRNNIIALQTLKDVELEKRSAAPMEQEALSRYVGWGGLPQAFDPDNKDWANEYLELSALLTPEEFESARASTLNAHYTSPVVVKAIWDTVGRLGFDGGNVLEPSCGVGNFFGLIPESMRGSKLYGVELDSVTARIAKQLYPSAKIQQSGFEKTRFGDAFFDLIIGNVPFGSYGVADKRYDKLDLSIHNYFFAKALDAVRPGGVVAFLTSKYTMDERSPKVRKYLAERAELLGAVRLPNNAFLKNAGTETTMDVLFLQKRDRPLDVEPDWVHLGLTAGGIPCNRYFIDNPETVCGVMGLDERMNNKYGRDDMTACLPIEGADLGEQLKAALLSVQGKFEVEELDDIDGVDDHAIPADPNVKNFSYTIIEPSTDDKGLLGAVSGGGTVYYRENSLMYPVDLPAMTLERIRGMIGLRDCVHKLMQLQLDEHGDGEIRAQQKELNYLYDRFVASYGLISSQANSRAYNADSAYYLLSSLEVIDENGDLERKADMFSKRTIRQRNVVTHVDTASEALAVSLGEKARVDMEYMSDLTGFSREKLIDDLQGVVFLNVGSADFQEKVYVTADEYLSGNVRKKLEEARAAHTTLQASGDGSLAVNVAALEAVQPKDLEAGDIAVRLGATWISPEYIQQFMHELLNTSYYNKKLYQVQYHAFTGEWQVTGKNKAQYSDVNATVTYGTGRMNAYQILDDTLNLRDVRVYDYVEDADGKEKRVLNKKQTMLAQQKQELIKQKFRDWIWQDPERRQTLVRQYNDLFNSVRPREYDGSHITFSGMNPEIKLSKHQVDGAARHLYGGNTLYAHVVGAGKTFTMIAAAMESKRLGLCHKSLISVPNHLTEQWAAEFLRLYPSANILVATKRDFEMRNRKKFCAKIATGDYDAVIIGHTQLEKIPMSRERQERMMREQILEIEEGIRELKSANGERFSIKQLEKTKRGLETRLTKLLESKKRDDVVTYEQLGVDRLYVDEAHNFKNLFLYTKMRNVAGLSTTEAQKSSDLYMKCRYMDEITGNKGVIFATGTPISNSMSEMYTMQRYLQYDTLLAKNLIHFDAWASIFGETVTSIELAPEGTGYRARTRFARFHNLPELMTLFKEVADIQTADMLMLPVPEAKYENIIVEPSELQKEMVQELSERAALVHARQVEPQIDNMLKITTDGRKIGLDQRLMNPLLPDHEGSKVNACTDKVYEIWNDTRAGRLTQLVFCDFSTPNKDGRFNVYDDIRAKLLERGVPESEIAFIHDADTEARKKELFAKVRQGRVRILFGSTFKMGSGTNVQDRLIAIHDADCPWRPADLEQRSGRIIRQGNRNAEVQIYRYATSGTFDSYLWQTVQKKQEFIAQIMSSKSPVRSCEDVDETALSFAEIKALCAGNPLIAEKMNLDNEVAKLRMLRAEHQSQHYRLEDDILKRSPMQIAAANERIEGIEKDIAMYAAIKGKYTVVQTSNTGGASASVKFPGMTVGGVSYTEKEPAAKALLDACKGVKGSRVETPVGEYMGFKTSLSYDSFAQQINLMIRGAMTYQIDLGTDALGNITRINNALDKLPERLEGAKSQLDNINKQVEAAKIELTKPFEQESELAEKEARLALLNADLNIDGDGGMDVMNDDEERGADDFIESVAGAPDGMGAKYTRGYDPDKDGGGDDDADDEASDEVRPDYGYAARRVQQAAMAKAKPSILDGLRSFDSSKYNSPPTRGFPGSIKPTERGI